MKGDGTSSANWLRLSWHQLAAVVVATAVLAGLTVATVGVSYQDEIGVEFGSVEQQPSDLQITDISHVGPGNTVDEVHVDIKNTNGKEPVAADVEVALVNEDEGFAVAEAEETELVWPADETATVAMDVYPMPADSFTTTDVAVTEIPSDEIKFDEATFVTEQPKVDVPAEVTVAETPEDVAVTDVTHEGPGDIVNQVEVELENEADEPVPIDVEAALADDKEVVTGAQETELVVPPEETGTVPIGVEPTIEDEFTETEVAVTEVPEERIDVTAADVVTEDPKATEPPATVAETPKDVAVTDVTPTGPGDTVDQVQVALETKVDEPVSVDVEAALVDDKDVVAKDEETELVVPAEEEITVPIDVEPTPEDEFVQAEVEVGGS